MIALGSTQQSGFSFIELIVVVAISGLIFVSLSSVVGEMFSAQEDIKSNTDLYQEADFVMEKIVRLLAKSSNSVTEKNNVNHVKVSVVMDPTLDMNKDGIADADDDGDGEVDEGGPDPVTKSTIEWKDGVLKVDMKKLTFDITGDGNVDNQDKIKFFVSDSIEQFSYSIITPAGSNYELAEIELTFADAFDSITLSTKVRLGGRL